MKQNQILAFLLVFVFFSSTHADPESTYFGASTPILIRSGYKRTDSNGFITYKREVGSDKQVRMFKKNHSAYIFDDVDGNQKKVEYLALDGSGKIQSRTSCRSSSSHKNSICITLSPDGQSPPTRCSNDSRNQLNCVTVNRHYCDDIKRLTDTWDPNSVASVSKIKECTNILSDFTMRLNRYTSLHSIHQVGTQRISSHFNIDASKLSSGPNPLTEANPLKTMNSIVSAIDACNDSSNQWSDPYARSTDSSDAAEGGSIVEGN